MIIFVIKANLQLAANALIKPLEAGKQFGKMCFDVAEVLSFFLKAWHASDPKQKAAYQLTCTEKCANLTYDTRKFLEATLASIAVGFVILANVTTFGGAAPTLAGAHALTSAHTLSAVGYADSGNTAKEYIETLVDAADPSTGVIEKGHDLAEKHDCAEKAGALKAELSDFKASGSMKNQLHAVENEISKAKAGGYEADDEDERYEPEF